MRSWVHLLLAVLLLLAKPALKADDAAAPCNALIMEAILSMPAGGGYSAGSTATRALQQAVSINDGKLDVRAAHATPSYCSGATYLVFLKVISILQSQQRLQPTPELLAALRPTGQPDGTGIWGRWNANGPGTARLFYELSLGKNFSRLSQAIPGDFMKIFWSDQIGAAEHGHSVIYLGTENKEGVPYLSYWSSNIPGGFGTKSVPFSRVHRMLFSRLEHPENLARTLTLPHSDRYLSSLQSHSSTPAEMAFQCGVR